MRSCSENYSRDAYVLKLDISGFFMSIDREILWNKIVSVIARNEVIHVPFCHPVGIPISSTDVKEIVAYAKDDIERDSSATRRNDKKEQQNPKTV